MIYRLKETCFEILVSEIPEIEIHFYQNDFELMHKLFDFFKQQKLDSSHTDMVCRVIGTLLEGNSNGMLEFLRIRTDAFEILLNHIKINSVMQLIIKFSKVEIYFDEYLEVFNNQNFIGLVIDKLSPENEDFHFDIVYGINDLIEQSEEHCCGLVDNLQNEDNLSKLFDLIVSDNSSSFIHGIKFINIFLQLTLQNQYEYDDIQNLLDTIIRGLPKIKTILSKDHKPTNTVGFNRINLMKLLRSISRFNNNNIYNAILEEDLISIMIELLFYFEDNNILQRYIIDCLTIYVEFNCESIIFELIEKKKFHSRIMEYVNEKKSKESPDNPRKSLIPLLIELAFELDNQKDNNETLKKNLDSTEWRNFIEENDGCILIDKEEVVQYSQNKLNEYNIDSLDI